jgi:hypothetical protein
MTTTDYRITRRGVLIGAAAALICAPAIVRAATLMPVRRVPFQLLTPKLLNPEGQFYRRCFYHSLDTDLRVGRAIRTLSNGKIISVAEAHRLVARARAQGWLPL